MKSEKSQHTKHKREFGGCVELIPSQPKLIEFIDSRRIWGFPIQHLAGFALEEISEHRNKPTLPPERLILVYGLAAVILRGWRLELMVEPLVNGRVSRVHAEKHLGTLIIEEAWVSEIQIFPLLNSDLFQPEVKK